jgi:hypothetical protein
MAPIVLKRFLQSSRGTWVQPSTFEDFYTMLWRFSNVPILTVFFIVVLVLAVFKWLIYDRTSEIQNYTKVVLIWFLFPFLIMFVVSLKYWLHPIPVFMDRYVIFISIAFYFSVSIALNYLLKKVKLKLIFYLFPIAILSFTFKINVDNKRNVNAVVSRIKTEMTSQAKLVICPGFYDLNLAYYLMKNQYYPDNNCFKDSLLRKMELNGIFPLTNKHELSKVPLNHTKKLIYLDAGADFSSPGNDVYDSLETYYRFHKLYEFPEIFKLYVFEKK